MPINWTEFDREIDSIIEESVIDADKRLATKIASISRLTDEEVKELFPEPSDIKKLVKLMKIVNSAESKNTKINKIVSETEELGTILLSLLSKFA